MSNASLFPEDGSNMVLRNTTRPHVDWNLHCREMLRSRASYVVTEPKEETGSGTFQLKENVSGPNEAMVQCFHPAARGLVCALSHILSPCQRTVVDIVPLCFN